MIAAQIAMFLAMRKYSGPIFEKLFKKSFNPVSKSESLSKIRVKEAAIDPTAVSKKSKIAKDYEEVKKDALGSFKFVVDIAAATIVGKRIIVPLIATPLAKKVESRMEAKKDGKTKTEENLNKEKESEQPVLQTIEPNFANNPDTNLLHKFQKK